MQNEYEIEIVETNIIDGGIEVFARAWKNGVQLGFGKDGTIDIERFRIFNPPVLVDDVNGSIVQTWTDQITNEVKTRTLSEDPEEAILQSLTHTISTVGVEGAVIVSGSRGNTTDTFYSGVGGDGYVYRVNKSTWANARDTADGDGADTASATVLLVAERETSTIYSIFRGYFPFDTSALPDGDTIDSATFSVWPHTTFGTQDMVYGVVQTSQASNTALAIGDYDALTLNTPTEGATRVDLGTTGAYKDFTLNASGLSWISKTSYTKLGIRHRDDIDNTEPAISRQAVYVYSSDQTGTANDPKLVVVHSAAAATFTPRVSFIM